MRNSDQNAGRVTYLSIFQANVKLVDNELPHLVNIVVVAGPRHLESWWVRVLVDLAAVVLKLPLNRLLILFNYFFLQLSFNVHFFYCLLQGFSERCHPVDFHVVFKLSLRPLIQQNAAGDGSFIRCLGTKGRVKWLVHTVYGSLRLLLSCGRHTRVHRLLVKANRLFNTYRIDLVSVTVIFMDWNPMAWDYFLELPRLMHVGAWRKRQSTILRVGHEARWSSLLLVALPLIWIFRVKIVRHLC